MPPELAELMSKGHCTGALYATLTKAGNFREDELASYMRPLSHLNGDPNCTKVPGVETNTGPLCLGMSVAVSIAIAAQIQALSAGCQM